MKGTCLKKSSASLTLSAATTRLLMEGVLLPLCLLSSGSTLVLLIAIQLKALEIVIQVQIAAKMLSDNSLRQTVHTNCAYVHQAAKLVAALLRVAGVTAGLAESNGSLPPGL